MVKNYIGALVLEDREFHSRKMKRISWIIMVYDSKSVDEHSFIVPSASLEAITMTVLATSELV